MTLYSVSPPVQLWHSFLYMCAQHVLIVVTPSRQPMHRSIPLYCTIVLYSTVVIGFMSV